MNRETSIYSSDTLVVTDRSRAAPPLVIIGAVAACAADRAFSRVIMVRSANNDQGTAGSGGQRRAGPDCDRHRAWPEPGRRVPSPPAARSPPSATSRSASPDQADASSACWSMPATGCARARRWPSSTARSRRSRPRSLPRKSKPRAPMPRWPSRIMIARLRSRVAVSCPRPRSIRRRRRGTPPTRRFALPRPSSRDNAREIGRLNVIAPASRAGPRP